MKKIGKNDKKWEKWQKSGKKLQKFDKQLGNFFLKKWQTIGEKND